MPHEQCSRQVGLIQRALLVRQEKDGSWWDFPFYDYHQSYGTSFVLQTLAKIR